MVVQILWKDQLGKFKMHNNVKKNLIKMLKFFLTYLKMLRNLCMKGIQVPDGYASNISRCIQLQECKIIGLKSHDSYLPIALQGSFPKKVTSTLINLSCIFREPCTKTLQVKELEHLESRIAMTLCNLESIFFPPSFFPIMAYLVTHMVTEAKIDGPIYYHWMYPIERHGNNGLSISFYQPLRMMLLINHTIAIKLIQMAPLQIKRIQGGEVLNVLFTVFRIN